MANPSSPTALMSGSLRQDSLNKKLARQIESLIGAERCDFLDLKEFPMPIYDGDVEKTQFPPAVHELSRRVMAARALIISTPEYNGSISSPLKTVADWLSRLTPVSLAGKHVLLTGASPGALGAVRGLWHTRIPFEVLGCHVFPEMFGLPKAHEAFTPEGQLKDDATRTRLQKLVTAFLEHVAGKAQT